MRSIQIFLISICGQTSMSEVLYSSCCTAAIASTVTMYYRIQHHVLRLDIAFHCLLVLHQASKIG